VVIAVGLCIVLLIATTCRLFVWPATDRPQQTDAIVALAGDPARQTKALALARAGYSHAVVASVDDPHGSECPAPEPGIQIFCFRPVPLNTRGEARYTAKLAAEHRWHRILIVPSTAQDTRARLLFKRCYSGEVLVVPASEPEQGYFQDIPYEWGASAKALFLERAC
jgi:hypothetical protein